MTLFDAQVAVDPVTNQLVKDGALQVFAEGDVEFTKPLAVTDLNGLTIQNVSTSPTGMAQGFNTVEDHLVVVAKSGPHTITLRSAKGTAQEAAKEATQEAKGYRDEVQAVLEQVGPRVTEEVATNPSIKTTIRAEVGAQMGPAATDAVEAAAEGLDLVTTARVPITIPAGLGWDTYTLAPTIAAALGTEGTHGDVGVTAAGLFDRHSTARTAPGAEFWVATTGSDAAAGTQAAPFRTIGKAIQAGNAAGVPTRVNVQAGVYQRTEGIYRSSADKPAVDLALVAVGGRVVTGLFDQLTLTADATHTNTYSAALGNCDRVLDLTTRNQYGIHPDITNVPTAAACNARPGSWAIEGGRLYVNRYDGAVPTPTNTRIYRHANSPFVVDAPVNVYVEGLDLSGGERGAMWAEPAGSTPWATPRVLVCASTTFRYAGYVAAPYARGMTVDSWNGLAAFFNCDASGNASDGFNVHNNKKATKVRLLTVNCSGNDNGRGMALSCQGATIHADVVWIDVAGSYRGNRGGNIFNVNTSRALLAGTYSANDRGDVIYGGIIDPTGIRCGGGATIWCDRTIVDQPRGTFAYFAEGTGTIHKRRTPPVPQPDAGAGTFATY